MSREDVINEIQKRGYDAFENNGELTILNEGFTMGFPVLNIDTLMNEKVIDKDGKMVTFPPIGTEDIVSIILASFNTKRDIKNGLYD